MYKYICKRLLQLLPVLIGVSLLIFVIMDLASGDVTAIIAGEDMTQAEIEELRRSLGLTDPLLVRYVRYMWNLLHGDMGTSYIYGKPVWDMFITRFPNTLALAAGVTVFAVLTSIPLGVYSAVHHGSLADNISMIIAMLGMSIPNFWFGLMLIIVFSLNLGWFPSAGNDAGLRSLVLPALTLGTDKMASLARITRSSMLDVIRADYLRTARAKGVPERLVIYKHALRNALIPIITNIGGMFAGCLGGATVTESVFTWPGVGSLIIDSIKSRDTIVVTGCIIIKTVTISIVLLLVDILYAYVDPRIKSQYTKKGGKKKNAE